MELVDGQPLSALLRPGSPLDPSATRALLAQVADGLGAAHAAGIVHRDVKPANLLVTPDRTIKITDFGIARAAEGLGLTRTGEVMGTPQYLSPEQAQGQTATPASDVYSLGVVAFECLAGRRPFVAETAVATALAHLRDPVPELPPSVPADLAAVVYRALSKAPEARYADGRAFAAALRDPATAATQVVPPAPPAPDRTQVMGGVPAAPPPPTTATPTNEDESRRGWLWAILGVVALALIAVLVILLLTLNDDTSDPTNEVPSRTPSTSSSAASTPSEPTTSATSADTTVRIDQADYVDRPVSDVERELGNLGLRVDKQRIDNPGDQIEGDVEGVNPTGALHEGDTVTVTYWGPAPPPTPPSSSAPAESSPPSSPSPSDSTSPSN
jgi:eukaryotic-like serine/threonine-protein kinase